MAACSTRCRSEKRQQSPFRYYAAFVLAVMLGPSVLIAADPVIDEFLASNKQTSKDEDGDRSDWIEIYNPGSAAISLDGYYLTDDRGELTKWKLPDVSLPGNGFLLVWASAKNRTDPAKPLHTNFKLSESGEYLGLVKPDGVTVVSDFGTQFPPQTADTSFGVLPGSATNQYLPPTPSMPNRLASPMAEIRFDHDRGLYTEPFDLVLSTATTGTTIRYTTDGSMPTTTTGKVYTGPLAIDNTIVVHAIGYEAGRAATAVVAKSYIFPSKVLRQPANIAGYPNPKEPVTNPGPHAINLPLTYGMDPDIVSDPTSARQALHGLYQIPTVSIGVDPNNIFGPDGFYDTPRRKDGQKIPISFEYIDPVKPQNSVEVGATITSHSKQKLKRSFHIHFDGKNGTSKLNALIFEKSLGGNTAASVFTDLILRGGNNRSWATTASPSKTTYTEDQYVRDTQIAMTGRGVHGTFVHLYLNGIYWGLYNLVERPDEGYGAAYFDSGKHDYFSISRNGVASGDATRWNYMMNTLAKQDLSVGSHYAEMQEYLDVKQFADYLIGQWFCGVSDWPDNNYWAGGDTSKRQPFWFYSWDGEEMINTANRFPTIPHGPWVNPAFTKNPLNNTGPIVELWTALKRSPEFTKMFAAEVDRNIAPDGPLSDANVLARWDALNRSISDAIVDESARWGKALVPTGRPAYMKNNAWIPATQKIADDLKGADAKFIAALRAEGYYP